MLTHHDTPALDEQPAESRDAKRELTMAALAVAVIVGVGAIIAVLTSSGGGPEYTRAETEALRVGFAACERHASVDYFAACSMGVSGAVGGESETEACAGVGPPAPCRVAWQDTRQLLTN